jgi:hypothetical protein
MLRPESAGLGEVVDSVSRREVDVRGIAVEAS